MTDHPSRPCPDGPHIHPANALLMFRGHLVVLDHNTGAVALVWDELIATRIATLLARHGLADVPDSLATPWPAPTGQPTSLNAPQAPT